MGAWGAGIFENDTACDFAAAVSDGGGMSLIDQTLHRVLACGDNYLEAPDAEECLATAEIIARLTGRPRSRDTLHPAGKFGGPSSLPPGPPKG
jgi:hypothetical protein